MMLVAALPNYLLLHVNCEKDKNTTDGGGSSTLLFIVARE